QEHFIGDMQPNTLQSNKFEYLWDTIDIDTGVSSGDNIEVIIRLTDIFDNTNEYHYFYIADFTNPTPSVSLGDGVQDFRSEYANPFTSVDFDSSVPDNNELWNEPLTTYDLGYMDHTYYPDDYSSTWNMNPLGMYNLFPTSEISEIWDNWVLNYDSGTTISSFGNGDLSTSLITGSDNYIPVQSQIPTGDFDMIKGTSDYSGDLQLSDNDYTTFDSTIPQSPGHYPGSYSFEDDTIGQPATGWYYRPNANEYKVESSLGGY
ncbi:unnamed protein product, partial [marine sediment metagenome]